jgi:hypothetical protein
MQFDIKDILNTVAPTAGLIFAAWIYLNVLQQRYTGSYDRYRALVAEFRAHQKPGDMSEQRHHSVKLQIGLYKKRCEQMRAATNIAVIAAIILTGAIAIGLLNITVLKGNLLKLATLALTLLGLILLIVSAIYLYLENSALQVAIDSEISDIPELSGI